MINGSGCSCLHGYGDPMMSEFVLYIHLCVTRGVKNMLVNKLLNLRPLKFSHLDEILYLYMLQCMGKISYVEFYKGTFEIPHKIFFHTFSYDNIEILI